MTPRFDHIPVDDPRWREGARLFNAGQFFESHEVLESLWHEVAGPDRSLLQGLIQAAAAYHHARRNNLVGARYLWERAERRLRSYGARHAGVALDAFRAELAQRLRAPSSTAEGPSPSIALDVESD